MTTPQRPPTDVVIINTLNEVTNMTTLELYLRGKQAEKQTTATISEAKLMDMGVLGSGTLRDDINGMCHRNNWSWAEIGRNIQFRMPPIDTQSFHRPATPQRFNPLADDASIKEMMSYHAPDEDQKLAFTNIAAAAIIFANVLRANVPDCADRSHALRCLRDARMWANSAVALKGKI